MHITVYRV